ncbi:unnamed protein product [Moneuplotes crassus]|uniref:BZIP domain-containing protein n=1 Tax=Euplotes crassus TaxID=5936 RepID=A0AAD1XLX4_EUPCR|nr:unnamed protein product [Moneuplotes crassus]
MEETENKPQRASRRKFPRSNVERSKDFRKRKKKFLEYKLNQVETLEREVKSLREENSCLKEKVKELTNQLKNKGIKVPKKKFDHPLHEYEDYLYNQLAKKFQSNPDEVRFSTFEQVTEHTSDWRIDYLKTCFKNILDNINTFHQ